MSYGGVDPEVVRVFKMLDPKPKSLASPGRRLLREGEVLNYNTKERRTKLKYFFLFNDVLLITKREGPKKFWLKVYITLQPTLKVADVPDSTYKVPNVEFRLYAPRRTFIFFCRTPANKESWINDIQSCINGRPNAPGHHSAPSSTVHAPSSRPRYDPYTGNASPTPHSSGTHPRGGAALPPEPNYEELYFAQKAKQIIGVESPQSSSPDRAAKGSPLLALAEDLGKVSVSDSNRKVSYVADAPSDGEDDPDFAALRFDQPSGSAKPDQSFDFMFSDPVPAAQPPASLFGDSPGGQSSLLGAAYAQPTLPGLQSSLFAQPTTLQSPMFPGIPQPGLGQPTMAQPGMMPQATMIPPGMMLIPAHGVPGGYMLAPAPGGAQVGQPMASPLGFGTLPSGGMSAQPVFPQVAPTQLAPSSTLNPSSTAAAPAATRDPFADLFSLK